MREGFGWVGRGRGIMCGEIEMTLFHLFTRLYPDSSCVLISTCVSASLSISVFDKHTRHTFYHLNGSSHKQFPTVLRPWLVICSQPTLPPVFSAPSHMCQMVSSHCWIHFHPPLFKGFISEEYLEIYLTWKLNCHSFSFRDMAIFL